MARVKSWVGGGDKTLRFLAQVGSLEDQMERDIANGTFLFLVCVCVWLKGMPKSGNELWYPNVWQPLLQIILAPFNPRKKNHPDNANKEDLAGSKSFGLTFPFSFGGYINSIHTHIYIYISICNIYLLQDRYSGSYGRHLLHVRL